MDFGTRARDNARVCSFSPQGGYEHDWRVMNECARIVPWQEMEKEGGAAISAWLGKSEGQIICNLHIPRAG
eukprot:4165652-Pyramimonas_sp.AAC.1